MSNLLPGVEATRAQITQEVRLAVVMYGGSSLAIYINGVTQELFNLVRATAVVPAEDPDATRLYLPDAAAPNASDRTLGGTEAVYRRLAQLLGTEHTSFEALNKDEEADAVHTRFVVDIISGTSAGGINGVFLAKALANDQDMGVLKNLWLNGGSFETLLNDAKSLGKLQDSRLAPTDRILEGTQKGPQSLLNSQRMYCMIYDALDAMEKSNPCLEGSKSPFVEDLDLFVTRTDIYGQPVAVKLSDDTVISELQHRDVVHFQYAQWLRDLHQSKDPKPKISSDEARGNDFIGANDPFLAYAARCTSAFPFAFEPMRLADVQPLAWYGDNAAAFLTDVKRWTRFFAEPQSDPHNDSADAANSQGDARVALQARQEMREHQALQRPFTDGGVLNNKPFSFAIDTLRKRWSDKSVQRKLVYIEPSPQDVSFAQGSMPKPDALAMVPKALIELPGYEAIHAELQRVLDRNAVIDRVNTIVKEVEDDLALLRRAGADARSAHFSQASQAIAVEGMWAHGWRDEKRNYKSYETILQERGIAYGAYHHLKVEAVSDDLAHFLACQMGLKEKSEGVGKLREMVTRWRQEHYTNDVNHLQTMEPDFLSRFDLDYRMRRLLFLRSKINEGIQQDIKNTAGSGAANALIQVKEDLRGVFNGLRKAEYRLTTLRDDYAALPLRIYLQKWEKWDEYAQRDAPSETLFWGPPPAKEESEKAGYENMQAMLAKINADISDATLGAVKKTNEIIKNFRALKSYMDNFEVYDSVLFPALYGTGVGETTHVDLIRISPLDATSLIDEHSIGGRKKLAGTALGNFGALLQRSWRTNDIMWGRLDASERLLRDLAPQNMPLNELNALITQAQGAIVSEELLPTDRQAIQQWLLELIPTLPTDAQTPQALNSLVRANLDARAKKNLPPLTPIFSYLLQADGLLDYMKADHGYEVDRTMPPRDSLQIASRSAAVVGKILQNAADARGVKSPLVAQIVRVGQVFVNMVEVALPNTTGNLESKRLLALAFLFEIFLVVIGVAFNVAPTRDLGIGLLLATALAYGGIRILHDTMQDVKTLQKVKRGALIVFGAVVLALSLVGVVTIYSYLHPVSRFPFLVPFLTGLGVGGIIATICFYPVLEGIRQFKAKVKAKWNQVFHRKAAAS